MTKQIHEYSASSSASSDNPYHC
uniref:Uncharacterized protein n=1 Tax=Ralstonia solanacearum TaxID=305 RepID=A0A0S4WLD0_RALSL|nr:protein of unknown function [Ralstonia solanacearum]